MVALNHMSRQPIIKCLKCSKIGLLEIALKLKRGRLQKAKGGGYAGGGAPFGYECLRGGKKLYVNATEAKAVRRVFEIKQSLPDMTLKSIAEFMKIEGHKGRKGADFNEESGTNSGTLILDATCAPQNISYGYKK